MVISGTLKCGALVVRTQYANRKARGSIPGLDSGQVVHFPTIASLLKTLAKLRNGNVFSATCFHDNVLLACAQDASRRTKSVLPLTSSRVPP